MSKLRSAIFAVFFCVAASVAVQSTETQSEVTAVIKLDAATRSARIKGRWNDRNEKRRNLSFLTSAPGQADLGQRVSDVKIWNGVQSDVGHRRFNSSEYVAEGGYTNFSYRIDLSSAQDPRSAAHSSWINDEFGVLFLEDLLPLIAGQTRSAEVQVVASEGWMIESAHVTGSAINDVVPDVSRAVFVLHRGRTRSLGTRPGLRLLIGGPWLFEDSDAEEISAELFGHYRKIFGSGTREDPMLAILPFPQQGIQKGMWEAETRGSTIVVVSSDTAFKTQSVQRLREQLRHEIFHLWMPNAVSLTGRYDWFYEGFALYQSLKTGVLLGHIRFDDYLDTLSRAHNIDRSTTRRRSLIDASKERWSGADTELYARGMLTAFIVDMTLLNNSRGRSGIEKIFRTVMAAGDRSNKDANELILNLLNAEPGLQAVVGDFIAGSKAIDLASAIAVIGAENEAGTSRTNLRISSKPRGSQRAILEKLGYNNWRRLVSR